jgi:hypothetical protein
MVRNFATKPTIEFHFLPDDANCLGVVRYWLRVDARGKRLESQVVRADPASYSPEVKTKLTTVSAAYASVPAERLQTDRAAWARSKTSEELNARPVPLLTPSAQRLKHYTAEWDAVFAKFIAEYNATAAEYNAKRGEFLALMETVATPDFKSRATGTAIILEVAKGDEDERSYALYRGTVWLCNRPLEAAQWQLLVDRSVEREQAELVAALAGEVDQSQTRERISPEIRRAVWIRDQGKCARCGSRERLEFDHIVPVTRGGSSTERNVELLCEVHNRAKSDSIM